MELCLSTSYHWKVSRAALEPTYRGLFTVQTFLGLSFSTWLVQVNALKCKHAHWVECKCRGLLRSGGQLASTVQELVELRRHTLFIYLPVPSEVLPINVCPISKHICLKNNISQSLGVQTFSSASTRYHPPGVFIPHVSVLHQNKQDLPMKE